MAPQYFGGGFGRRKKGGVLMKTQEEMIKQIKDLKVKIGERVADDVFAGQLSDYEDISNMSGQIIALEWVLGESY